MCGSVSFVSNSIGVNPPSASWPHERIPACEHSFHAVRRLIRHPARRASGEGEEDLTTITIADHEGHDAGTIVATDGHPFWVPEVGEWVDAGDLLPGDWLSTSAGILVQVTAVQHDHREQTVHNLTVADTHTYYVAIGADAVLVHNCAVNPPGVSGE
ncbi:polymorphic toxin-type HINT domain-containing protein [Agromyces marinus]|uniref:polymorphic toxin-type HINT domain-containing protein n=1 Tax=Agromyces marinus TaxID=1389020 RepID=UPI001F3F288D|nr:polymorphic toxin-type HINT domain-containing protein [Agromyces marinus]UIP58661.1 hypothetical protein DSM26151_15400 [Agromyces marinus]